MGRSRVDHSAPHPQPKPNPVLRCLAPPKHCWSLPIPWTLAEDQSLREGARHPVPGLCQCPARTRLSVGPAASPVRAPSRPARAAPGAARPRRAPHLSSDPSAPGSPAAHGTGCSSRYALADGLNPHAAAAAGGRPGGSATARPRQAPRGKGGRRERAAPPPRPSFTPAGSGQAAPPHPGPHRGGTGLRRPGPAPPGGGGSAEAAGEGGRGPGRRRRSPESGRGQRVGLSWRSSARWSRVGARQPGCGRPGLRRAAPARGQHPRQGNAVREGGRRLVFLLLPEIKRCRRLAPGTASSGCAGKGPFPAAAQQEAQPPGTPLFEAGSPPGAPAFTRQREAVPGGGRCGPTARAAVRYLHIRKRGG